LSGRSNKNHFSSSSVGLVACKRRYQSRKDDRERERDDLSREDKGEEKDLECRVYSNTVTLPRWTEGEKGRKKGMSVLPHDSLDLSGREL